MSRPVFMSPTPSRPGRLDASTVVVLAIALLGSVVALGGWMVMLLVGIFGGGLSYGDSLLVYVLLFVLFILLPRSSTPTRSQS